MGHATLIVIDQIDSLLTKSGGRRDAKWGILINALLERTAHSHLVLTSRRLPTDLQAHPALLHSRINPLRRRERFLLARELPNLRPLFDHDSGRTLLRRTLSVTRTCSNSPIRWRRLIAWQSKWLTSLNMTPLMCSLKQTTASFVTSS